MPGRGKIMQCIVWNIILFSYEVHKTNIRKRSHNPYFICIVSVEFVLIKTSEPLKNLTIFRFSHFFNMFMLRKMSTSTDVL